MMIYHAEDVERLKKAVLKQGLNLPDHIISQLYSKWSEWNSCSGWEKLPDTENSLDELVSGIIVWANSPRFRLDQT